MKTHVTVLMLAIGLIGVFGQGVASAETGSQADYPPSYFKTKKPEVIVVKRRAAAASRTFDGHWGWVHVSRTWSYRTAVDKGRKLRNLGLGAGTATAVIGVAVGGPAGLAIANLVEAASLTYLSNRVLDSAADSHHRGVKFDAGLWCYEIPVAPDPCRPRISIRSR